VDIEILPIANHNAFRLAAFCLAGGIAGPDQARKRFFLGSRIIIVPIRCDKDFADGC
jgi:hypothetical protein